MLYSTNDITFIYDSDNDNALVIPGMDKPSGISIRKKLKPECITYNIVLPDHNCRALFGHDFMRKPNYKIFTYAQLDNYLRGCRYLGDTSIYAAEKHLSRTATAYKMLCSIDTELKDPLRCMHKVIIGKGAILDTKKGGWFASEKDPLFNTVSNISIASVSEMASTDTIYDRIYEPGDVCNKWVISYVIRCIPSNMYIGQIWIPTDDPLSGIYKRWLTKHIKYENMHIINRQWRTVDNIAFMAEITIKENNEAPKEILRYIFDEHEQICPPSTDTITRTTTDGNMFILIYSIIILIVNSIIIIARR